MSEKKVSGTINVTGVIDGQDGQNGKSEASVNCSPGSITVSCDIDGKVKAAVSTMLTLAWVMTVGGNAATVSNVVVKSKSIYINVTKNSNTQFALSIPQQLNKAELDKGITFTLTGTYGGDTYQKDYFFALVASQQGQQGNPGNDAVVYSLQCSPDAVNFRSNAVGEFSGSQTVECQVKKIVGNAAPVTLSPRDMRYDGKYYLLFRLLPDGDWDIGGNTVTVTAADAVDDGRTGIEFVLAQSYDQSTYAPVDAADRKVVPVICDGRRGVPGAAGATGKMFYPMGEWNKNTLYTKTGDLIPLVHHEKGDKSDWNPALECFGNYWYLTAATSQNNMPADGSAYWAEASSFGVVITQGLFAEFAKMGKGIFSGDYFFSMNGRIGSQEYIAGATYTEGGVTRPAYTWFKGDPTQQPSGTTFFYPNWWVDLKTGKMSAARGNFVVDGNGDVLVSGTIRARNLFHNVITFRDGGYYSNNWFYLQNMPTIAIDDPNADYDCANQEEYDKEMAYWSRFKQGGYYDWTDEEDAPPSATPTGKTLFVQCSGDADTIIMMARSANYKWQYEVPLMLPRPDDFNGKLITVISRVRDGSPKVACVKDGNVFANNVRYDDENFHHDNVYENLSNTIPMLEAYYVDMYAGTSSGYAPKGRRETFDKKVFHAQDGYWLRIE